MASTRQFFNGLFAKKEMRRFYPHRDSTLRAYFRDISTIALLGPAEETHLLIQAMQGDLTARKRLIEANLRLVVSIAARFQGCGLTMMELIAEGNVGLMEAVERFDFSLSLRLSTYAKYWILKYISAAAAEQTKAFSMPVSTAQKMERVARAVSALLNQGWATEPATKEIAKRVGLSTEQVVELLTFMQEPSSLEWQHAGKDEDTFLSDLIEGPPLLLSTEVEPSSFLTDVIAMMRRVLTEDEREVVERRFGLFDGIVYSYHDIARDLFNREGKRADERIKQLERSAFEKLRTAFDGQ